MPKIFQLQLPPEIGLDKAACLAYCTDYVSGAPFVIKRRSIDARSKQIKIQIKLEVYDNSESVSSIGYRKPKNWIGDKPKCIIVGAGPAGLFAALELIELGICPVILERGKTVRDRRRDLALLNKQHIVNTDSNYCFGEGGAGTYSDGKLYTRSDKRGDVRKILEILQIHGAPEDILVDAHPHIGTNKLPQLIENIRHTILSCGGQIHFESRVVSLLLKSNTCQGVTTADGKEWMGTAVLLATGHSARDVFYMLKNQGVYIESKPFALGVRVEHPQSYINEQQYHHAYCSLLPSASYSLVAQIKHDGLEKGVFSFCMCPGGIIAPSATAPGEIVVNGWSPSRRNNYFANSGIVVTVNYVDWKHYEKEGALAAMSFQKAIEKKACVLAGGTQKAPAQMLKDFMQKKESVHINNTSYVPGVESVPMDAILPTQVTYSLREAFKAFNKSMKGFIHPEAHILGVESRTSSPVRIPRDPKTLQHIHVGGLFPCGEGAGYAGGIISAAVDGQNSAKMIAQYVK